MSTYDYNDFATVVGTGLLIAIISWILIVVLAIIGAIGQWKICEKVGKKGWEALIVGHNQFTICELTGVNPLWLVFVMFSPILDIIPVLGSILSILIIIYFLVIFNVSVAKSFGKGQGFAIGLAIPITAPFFWLTLGGKNTQYLGAKPMNDVVMNFINSKKEKNANQNNTNNMNMNNGGFPQPMNNMNQQPMSNMNSQVVNEQPNVNFQNINQQPVNSQTVQKFCTNCGYKLSNGENFCPGCGNSVQ